MEFIIDTVNLEEIKDAVEHMPIVGVTSNPSIVKATSPQEQAKKQAQTARRSRRSPANRRLSKNDKP